MGHPGVVAPRRKRVVTATFLSIAFLPVSAPLVKKLWIKRVQ